MSNHDFRPQGGVQAPLLGRLLSGIDDNQRVTIADFGVGASSVLKVFEPYRARLDTLDIHSQLPTWHSVETREERAALIGAHIDSFQLEPVDLVCCWSVLNYIEPSTMTLVIQALKPYMKANAAVHALIEYSSPSMPATPPSWTLKIVNEQLHLHAAETEAVANSPRHTPKRLEAILGGMKAQSTVLLSNGLQEYIFRPTDPPVADS